MRWASEPGAWGFRARSTCQLAAVRSCGQTRWLMISDPPRPSRRSRLARHEPCWDCTVWRRRLRARDRTSRPSRDVDEASNSKGRTSKDSSCPRHLPTLPTARPLERHARIPHRRVRHCRARRRRQVRCRRLRLPRKGLLRRLGTRRHLPRILLVPPRIRDGPRRMSRRSAGGSGYRWSSLSFCLRVSLGAACTSWRRVAAMVRLAAAVVRRPRRQSRLSCWPTWRATV